MRCYGIVLVFVFVLVRMESDACESEFAQFVAVTYYLQELTEGRNKGPLRVKVVQP